MTNRKSLEKRKQLIAVFTAATKGYLETNLRLAGLAACRDELQFHRSMPNHMVERFSRKYRRNKAIASFVDHVDREKPEVDPSGAAATERFEGEDGCDDCHYNVQSCTDKDWGRRSGLKLKLNLAFTKFERSIAV